MKPKRTEHISATGKKFTGTPAEFYLANNMPYARLTLADRREILVNAFHEPLWVRGPGLPPTEMTARAKVHPADIVWTDRLYADEHRHHEKRHLAKKWLEEFSLGLAASLTPQNADRKRVRD